MKIERCNVVAEQLKDWDFLNNLPQQVLDFQLKKVFSQDGAEYTFVRYENADSCALDVVYTEETGDFVVVKNVGLFRFRDDRLYSCFRLRVLECRGGAFSLWQVWLFLLWFLCCR